MDNEKPNEESLDKSKKVWESPELSELSTKDTEGGGFATNETTTTKPGS